MRKTHLQEAVEFIRGITFKPDELIAPDAPGAVVCMRTKNIQSDLDVSNLIAVPRSLVRSEEKLLRAGDILLSSANSWELVGKSVAVPNLCYAATAGGFISIVRPKHGVHHRYLYHWLTQPSVQHTIRHCGRQTTNISNLDIGRFLELEIPHPPIDEQQRIAAILDKADAIRRKRRQALAEIDALLRATFLDMFGDPATNPKGWRVSPLEGVTQTDRPITYGIVQAGPHIDGGIPYIKTSDFLENEIKIEGLARTSAEIASKYARSAVKAGDLVFCIRASVGSVARVPSILDGANLTQGTALIAPGPKVDASYLLFALRSAGVQSWIDSRQKGATFKEITLKTLRETPVPVPPLKLQEEFGRRTSSMMAAKAQMKAASDEACALFGSLSQRAFRGEL